MRSVRWRDIVGRPQWVWADVSSVSPLEVTLPNAPTVPLRVIGCGVAGLVVGDRVRVQKVGSAAEIIYKHHTY